MSNVAECSLPEVLHSALLQLSSRFTQNALGKLASGCSSGGLLDQDRCWYLSDVGASCGETCSRHGLDFWWLVSTEEDSLIPKLLGKSPSNRSPPWARLECYVPEEDRFHTAAPDSDKSAHDNADLKTWSYASCQLACPCSSEELWTTSQTASLLQGGGMRNSAITKYLKQKSELINVASSQNGGRCTQQSSSFADEGIEGGFGCSLLIDGDRSDGYYSAWATKGQGQGASFELKFEKPYILEYLRYQQRPEAGEWNKDVEVKFSDGSQQTFSLMQTGDMQTFPLAPVLSDSMALTVQSSYATTNNGATEVQVLARDITPEQICPGGGYLDYAMGKDNQKRCWYLSSIGGTCGSTCNEMGLQFQYLLSDDGPMVPKLIGKTPTTANGPWGRLECYVPEEDRFHSAQIQQAENTLDRGSTQDWSYPSCRLACPCAMLSDTMN